MKTNKMKYTKSLQSGRKTKMLLVFLGVSLLFWVLIKFSKEYTDTVQFRANYLNLPKGKMLHENASQKVDVIVKAFGFDLIKHHLYARKIDIDLQHVKRQKNLGYYQLSEELLPEFNRQLSGMEVLSIQPDTLFYTFGVSKNRTVKINANLLMDFESGYHLLGNLDIKPNEISISGPEHLVDSISEVLTKQVNLENINSSFNLKVPLIMLAKERRVNYSVDEVEVGGEVEKFTETKLRLPFSVKNIPSGYKITTFPDELELVFQVGISDFNSVNASDFKIVCDYNKTVKNGLTYLIPELIDKPSIATQIKIVPNQIEYLIKE